MALICRSFSRNWPTRLPTFTRRGVLHMDLKPSNVMVESAGGSVVLIDLGFAVVADTDLFRKFLGSTQSDQLNGIVTDDEIKIASTEKYTRTTRQQYLGKSVSRKNIKNQ